MARRNESRFDWYARSAAVQAAGEEFIARNPGVVQLARGNETAGALYLRTLAYFSDPHNARGQADLLGLRQGASRKEILGALAERLEGVLPPSTVEPALAAARQAMTEDQLYDRMANGEADAARARNGGKAPVEKPEPRKLDDQDIRREDIKAALRAHGGRVETGDRSRGRYVPSTSLQTDIAMSMWQHGATDRSIEMDSPGAQEWSREGTHASRIAAIADAMDARQDAENGDRVRDWLMPDEDDDDGQEQANDNEVSDD